MIFEVELFHKFFSQFIWLIDCIFEFFSVATSFGLVSYIDSKVSATFLSLAGVEEIVVSG